jgi:8-oxo-dGTP diphosphatase
VEEGEPLEEAVKRECKEETGIDIVLIGVTGTYYNTTSHILSIVFFAKHLGGELALQPEEIREARFIKLDEGNIDEYITRPHMRSRTLDAMNSQSYTPCESWEVKPYKRIGRVDGVRG